MIGIRGYWLILILVTACPEQLGNRCGPDLPPCPSGTMCVEATCQEEGAGGGSAAGGRAGGAVGGGQSGGIGGGEAGGSVGGGSVGGGSVGGGSVGGGSVGGGSVGGGSVGGGSVGGGSVGGGSVGGGSVGGCPCPEYEECVANSCLRRYFGITVVVPPKTRLPTVVQASLQPVPGRVQNPPLTLNVTTSLDGSVGWTGSLISIADGGYASMNSFPANVEGSWSVFVAWPDGGPSGAAVTEVDLRGPQLTVTWPAPPVPVLQPQGADFRDATEPQDAGGFWRRSDLIPVRIQSVSRDLESASIQIRLGGDLAGVSLIGCTGDGGLEDAGLLADGGFCRIARVPASRGTFTGLRGSLSLTANANDDIGNTTNIDAGLVGLSRWAFSFTSSSANGFALGKGGLLVVPQTSSSSFTVLEANGSLAYERVLSQPPTSNVAIGQENPQRVYALESNGTFSQGETFDLKTNTQLSDWASWLRREGLFLRPMVSEDSVAIVHVESGVLRASWASFTGATATTGVSGTSVLDGGVLGAVATGKNVLATDGFSVVGLSGNRNGFNQLATNTRVQSPTGFSSIVHFIGSATGFAGSGLSGGNWRHFDGSLTSFTSWGGSFPEQFDPPIKGPDGIYFLRQFGAWSSVCMTGLMTNSTSCVPATGVDRMYSLALGTSKSLYVSVVRSGASFIQVRSSLSLALMNEIPLPAVTGACLSLTPTCIAGSPVVGCVDTTGKIVFVSTDERGVETAADWPMEGHDPGRTNNSTTDLTPYACP